MIGPHLLSCYCDVALQLLDCLIGHEMSFFQPAHAHGELGELDQQCCPTDGQAGSPHSKPGSGQAADSRLEQDHQSRDQHHRTPNDQTKCNAYLTELLRHLRSGELAFLTD
jgi:hypothetical protein